MAGLTRDQIDPKVVANMLRAGLEPLIVEHFGASEDAMGDFVRTAEVQQSAYLQQKHQSDDIIFIALSLARNN